jgi:hypothetical protein
MVGSPREADRGISLKAELPVESVDARLNLDLGRFHAPTRISLRMGNHLKVLHSAALYGEIVTGSERLITLWPTSGETARLEFKKDPVFMTPGSMHIVHHRELVVNNSSLAILDHIRLQDQFQEGQVLEIKLPGYLRILRTEPSQPVQVRVTDDLLRITLDRDMDQLDLKLNSSAEAVQDKIHLSGWPFRAVQQSTILVIRWNERIIPLIPGPVPALHLDGTDQQSSQYTCRGSPATDDRRTGSAAYTG